MLRIGFNPLIYLTRNKRNYLLISTIIVIPKFFNHYIEIKIYLWIMQINTIKINY